ncbi:MutS-related protein [Plebeiibacterium marinum]|uniref:DNA mismatch repair proteins mutS family domain-containing protein n=1 Tax=Plebeiibacterium marinum TaxID=2992111 RepID=A0AAE3MFN9_9BACT|nr:hypothetical protein [Plebeiobacterium marinum]MCW3806846.1 hypothetical protein [Plebeiobacterium marinum]
MSIKRAIAFTEFEWFYNLYKPLTPYGLEHKNSFNFIADKNELIHIHKTTKAFIRFITVNQEISHKIEYHLKKIDLLNSLDKVLYDATDLYLIKRLIIHYKAIETILPESIKKPIGFKFKSADLLNTLMPDNDTSDSFYLSSSFDKNLGIIRSQISEADLKLNSIKLATLNQLKNKYNLDFWGRDFLLIEKTNATCLDDPLLYFEYYDATYMMVKPVFANEYLNLMQIKDQLLIDESEVEKEVLQFLTKQATKHKENIASYTYSIQLLDTFMAKARMAIEYNLVCPQIDSSCISIKNGVFLPLEHKHKNKGMNYTPLNAEFRDKATLLSGSNMGGKTVLLKTIGFLQLLTQYGFWVPAEQFKTQLFDQIHVHGDTEFQNIEGLSSFGQEIHNLSQVFKEDTSRKLLLVDELAKTTNATEAKAILYALLTEITTRKNTLGFFSTHFINMPPIVGVSRFKMKGLDREKFSNFYVSNKQNKIQEKIMVINQFMQYEIEIDDGKTKEFDALTIAELLGMDKRIIARARNYLQIRKTK